VKETACWQPVIGLEVHVQLATRTKLFSAASNHYGDVPNIHVDPVTLGMPGVLPVLNREAVTLALRLGLALGSEIDLKSRFARKHYFYPDLPKGYQISQYEAPICRGGSLTVDVDDVEKTFRIHRIHLEEDAGKTSHDGQRGVSNVDYNRAGVPLVETVSEPDLRSSKDAVSYLKALHQLVVALGVSHGNMEEGNFRCDVNVSVRRGEDAPLGTRVEIKNVNSFRFVARAIEHEMHRQIEVLESGGEVVQETRLWDEQASVTRPMRGKEDAHDYRYFPDPDLMALSIDPSWVDDVALALPELPRARKLRFYKSYGLSAYDAETLTQSVARADYFEAVLKAMERPDPKGAANWVLGEVLASLKGEGEDVDGCPVCPVKLSQLLALVSKGTLSMKMAKACFQDMCTRAISPADWAAEKGGQITDKAAIAEIVAPIISQHPGQVAAYRAGKVKLLGFFVGQVMRVTGGRANPSLVNEVVTQLLEEE